MRSSAQEPADRTADREQSLEEMFAQDAERLGLTPEKVRSAMDARIAQVRQQLLAEYGFTEERLNSVSEETKSKLASKRMYEMAHSPNAKLERGFYQAAVAREKRLLVKSKAEDILAIQRKRTVNFSIPKKLVAAVRQRSAYLYHSELRDHFRSKYIEAIEKSDLLLPEFKAAAKAGEEPNMPNLWEVGNEMSAQLQARLVSKKIVQ
jgi:hypothetical protein